jgi:hypothetical protein
MIEKSSAEHFEPATDSVLRPGDFILGSLKSRALARALLDKRTSPDHPPDYTLDLGDESLEHCQEIYARAMSLPTQGPVPTDTPYMVIRFPEGFTSNVVQTPSLDNKIG